MDPAWVPNYKNGENPLVYQVFYALRPDQGFFDQVNGQFVWAHEHQAVTRLTLLSYKRTALANPN